MNKKIKLIIDYLSIFFMSIFLFLFCILFILKFTLLKQEYIEDVVINNNDYINYLYDDIKKEMTYYTNQSGFNDDIIDDTFDNNDIKRDLYISVCNMYGGKCLIDTSAFKEKLNKKIDDYLEVEKYTIVNRGEIDTFVTEMSNIYMNKLSFMNLPSKIGSKMNKVIRVSNILILLLPVIILIILLINRLSFKNKRNSIVLYTNMFLLLNIYLYIKYRIDIKHLFIYDEGMTVIINDIINKMLNDILLIAIVSFILGTIINLLKKYKKSAS